jgi:hypothetical protein
MPTVHFSNNVKLCSPRLPLQDQIFPDPAWNRKTTVLGFLGCFLFVLGPYWIAGAIVVVNRVNVSPARACAAIMIHTIGVVVMMAADTQKFFVLKERRGLISDGWFYATRNPNYVGSC